MISARYLRRRLINTVEYLRSGVPKWDEIRVFVLVAIAVGISITGIIASSQYYSQQQHEELTQEAKAYMVQLAKVISSDEETIRTIANNNSRPESEFSVVTNQIFANCPLALRIELRTEDGTLLAFKDNPKNAIDWRKDFRINPPPSVQFNLMKAVQLHKTFWSRSYSPSGEPLIDTIQPVEDDKHVWVVSQLQSRWTPPGSGLQVSKPLSVQVLDSRVANSKTLSENQSVEELSIPGLELKFIFTHSNAQSHSVKLDSTTLAIALLGLILSMLLIKNFLDTRENRLAHATIERQSVALQKQSEMNSLAEISTTIAHELNQPLGAITNYLTMCELMLKQQGYSDSKVLDALQKARAQSLRAGEVIKWIRGVVNHQPQEKVTVAVKGLVDNLEPYLQTLSQKHFAKLEVLCDENYEIKAVPILLELVMVNLVKNGLEAMENTPKSARKIRLHVFKREFNKPELLQSSESFKSIEPIEGSISLDNTQTQNVNQTPSIEPNIELGLTHTHSIEKVAPPVKLSGIQSTDDTVGTQSKANFGSNGLNSSDTLNGLNDAKDPYASQIRISGDILQIDVIDSGSGVKSDDSSSLFSTFFTTKAQGMGVGLSLCNTVAESLGGQMLWRNNPDNGATFTMVLPL